MTGIVRVFVLVVVVATLTIGEEELPNGYKIVNPFMCSPGSRFKLDCNFCRCLPEGGGVGACTRMACSLGRDECIPGSYFQINSNLCSCPNNGYKWDSDCFER